MSLGYFLNIIVDDRNFVPTREQLINTIDLLHAHGLTQIPYEPEQGSGIEQKYLKYVDRVQTEVNGVNWDEVESSFVMFELPVNGEGLLALLQEQFDTVDDYYLVDRGEIATGNVIISTSVLTDTMGQSVVDWNSRFQILGLTLGNPRWERDTVKAVAARFMQSKAGLIDGLETELGKPVTFKIDWSD